MLVEVLEFDLSFSGTAMRNALQSIADVETYLGDLPAFADCPECRGPLTPQAALHPHIDGPSESFGTVQRFGPGPMVMTWEFECVCGLKLTYCGTKEEARLVESRRGHTYEQPYPHK